MLNIKKGDYFDYQDEDSTVRIVAYYIVNSKYCHATDINDLDSAGYLNKVYIVDVDKIKKIIGNIFE